MEKRIKQGFFALLSAELSGEKATGLEDLSTEEVEGIYRVAQLHDLAHLTARGLNLLGVKPMGGVASALQKEWMLATYLYEQFRYELDNIVEAFEREKIAHIPLKGAVLRDYYPEPWMRTSCDVDVFVKEEDLERAQKVLVETLGYRMGRKGVHDIAFDSPQNVHVELHFDLIEFERLPKARAILEKVWEESAPVDGYTYRYAMSNEAFYFYHVAHMAKHFLSGGCGVRSFMDLWILQRKLSFDENKLEEMLKTGGMQEFARQSEGLANAWFSGGAMDPVSQRMEDYLLQAGVYGSAENRVMLRKKPKGGKIGYLLSRLFLPYSILKKQYPVLEKQKWLFPFCQIARWFRLLFKGRSSRSVREFKAVMTTSDEKRNRTLDLYKTLGLS